LAQCDVSKNECAQSTLLARRTVAMPDVGLFSASEPLPKDAKVVVKFSVEVEGLPVYTETYDVGKIAAELDADPVRAVEIWARRIKCPVGCRDKPGFSACLTRCLTDGQCCERGHQDCNPVE
jgi:hypothetical protein